MAGYHVEKGFSCGYEEEATPLWVAEVKYQDGKVVSTRLYTPDEASPKFSDGVYTEEFEEKTEAEAFLASVA